MAFSIMAFSMMTPNEGRSFQHNDGLYNDIQHSVTQWNDTQHVDAQHNDSYYNGLRNGSIQYYDI